MSLRKYSSIVTSYGIRNKDNISWIKGEKNTADAITTAEACDALQRLIDTNRLDLDLDGWVERQNYDS